MNKKLMVLTILLASIIGALHFTTYEQVSTKTINYNQIQSVGISNIMKYNDIKYITKDHDVASYCIAKQIDNTIPDTTIELTTYKNILGLKKNTATLMQP